MPGWGQAPVFLFPAESFVKSTLLTNAFCTSWFFWEGGNLREHVTFQVWSVGHNGRAEGRGGQGVEGERPQGEGQAWESAEVLEA